MTSSAASRKGEDEEVHDAFAASVEEGERRLRRTLPGLLATGLIGGVDISVGVLALLVVEHETGSRLLGSLAFGTGFIALTLGRSELFTENFLLPVTAVVTQRASVWSLLRLWAGTATANLAGGWCFIALVMVGLPELAPTAIETARAYPELGIGVEAFSLGVVGGAIITVMTWMQAGSDTEFGKLLAAVTTAFLLASAPLNHVIVVSVEMFAALHAGAPFGYAAWVATAAWAAVANLVGGLLLVTVFRLVQVGRREIALAAASQE
jgi:formate/nitrite transporter FocA (FNT family)